MNSINDRNKTRQLFHILLICIIIFSILDQSAKASNLNIANGTSITRYNTDGTGATAILSTNYLHVRDIAVDSLNDDVYYTAYQNNYYQYIFRDNAPANYDPTNADRDTLVDFWDNAYRINKLDIDPISRQLAITSENTAGPSLNFTRYTNVYTRDVDTGSQQTLYQGGKYYIIRWQGYYNPTPLWGDLHDVEDVAIDPVGQQAYWTDRAQGNIMRTNLDGSGGTEIVHSGLNNPQSLVLDVGASTIFWTDVAANSSETSSIQSGSMHGTGPVNTIVSGLSTSPFSLDIDPFSSQIYWADGTMHSVNYNGTNITDMTNSAGNPLGGTIVAIGHDAGNTPQNPFMPDSIVDNKLTFENIATPDQGQMLFFDPEIDLRYEYISTNSAFASVLLPNIGDGTFDLYLFDGSDYIFDQQLLAGIEFEFEIPGVDRFLIEATGIEGHEILDPSNPTVFLTGLSFTDDGSVTDVNIIITPEPTTLLLVALGGMMLRKRRNTQKA